MPTTTTSAQPSTTINYVDIGEGNPIVLIHGWPLSHRMWEHQINALVENGYRVIAYDRRGFGDSGRPQAGYDYNTFASDLNDIMELLDLRNAVIVGFSMGGGEVARYIGNYGTNRLSGAALLGAVTPFMLKTDNNPNGAPSEVFDGMLEGVKKDRIGFLNNFFPAFYNTDKDYEEFNPDLIPYSKSIAWTASPIGTQQCIVAFGTTDFRSDLTKFDVPTLIIHGSDDRIVPIEMSAIPASSLIKDSKLETIEGAPHGFAATHASEMTEILIKFLKELK